MKFSIRDLVLLTAIVALTLGWWLDHRRSANELALEREFRSKLEGKLVETQANAEEAWRILMHNDEKYIHEQ